MTTSELIVDIGALVEPKASELFQKERALITDMFVSGKGVLFTTTHRIDLDDARSIIEKYSLPSPNVSEQLGTGVRLTYFFDRRYTIVFSDKWINLI